MADKNICGPIPEALHDKVRQEIERDAITTKEFLRKVIEEHFMEKGVDHMAARTIAVQVSDDFFKRLKRAVGKKGCKQKDFLMEAIERAILEVESTMQADEQEDMEISGELAPAEESETEQNGENPEEATEDEEMELDEENNPEQIEEEGEPESEEASA